MSIFLKQNFKLNKNLTRVHLVLKNQYKCVKNTQYSFKKHGTKTRVKKINMNA